jgi:hypothetical protein
MTQGPRPDPARSPSSSASPSEPCAHKLPPGSSLLRSGSRQPTMQEGRALLLTRHTGHTEHHAAVRAPTPRRSPQSSNSELTPGDLHPVAGVSQWMEVHGGARVPGGHSGVKCRQRRRLPGSAMSSRSCSALQAGTGSAIDDQLSGLERPSGARITRVLYFEDRKDFCGSPDGEGSDLPQLCRRQREAGPGRRWSLERRRWSLETCIACTGRNCSHAISW